MSILRKGGALSFNFVNEPNINLKIIQEVLVTLCKFQTMDGNIWNMIFDYKEISLRCPPK